MVATAIGVTTVTRTGVLTPVPVACDAVNGNSCVNGNDLWLEFTNSDTSSHTIQITRPGTVDGVANPSTPITIAAGAVRRHGQYSVPLYGSTLTWTVDSALVKVTAFQLAP